ncbi:MAG: phosphoenolpyruvate carboxykinase (ATP) [Albidovulum sp.]|nr:phosphoenolpyruvate carboxykinase (ATP) [Albidovulum sp.]
MTSGSVTGVRNLTGIPKSFDFSGSVPLFGEASRLVRNAGEHSLVQQAVSRGEGVLCRGGSLLVSTGSFTGRVPNDKFIVESPGVKDDVWWENSNGMSASDFDRLFGDVLAYASGGEFFVQDLQAGADPASRMNVRVFTELAWHSLFIRHLLLRPKREELTGFLPDCLVVACPGFKATPAIHGCRSETAIAMDLERKIIVICGTGYAGEMKKAVFSLLNYTLPAEKIMPMHCSANHAIGDPSDSAIFFGLSGTGKTTLSSDPRRILVGDDEHGWSSNGIFNFEGGCYAKTLNLSADAEPEIYATTSKFGTVIENVSTDPSTGDLDFADSSITENARCAYPLESIPSASKTGRAGPPGHIVMLTCDAFGVLPALSRLTSDQAIYHFLSGFTSKIGGTERGIKQPQPTFSACFGQPFIPRHPKAYGKLLRERIESAGSTCWLLNTGWTGGGYGRGSRMPLQVTRGLLNAVLGGSLDGVPMRSDPNFGLLVPERIDSVADSILNPRLGWNDGAEYDRAAVQLNAMFEENYRRLSR